MAVGKFIIAGAMVLASSLAFVVHAGDDRTASLDTRLARVLRNHGFTGRVEATLEDRLGRRIEPGLANLGRLLFFDNIQGLHEDNSCAGCHSPSNGFGDTQSIAIGVDNNRVVGPNRKGPRNQRRSPQVVNTAFYPRLMWNGRFLANGHGSELGDPFMNNNGFSFPDPEAGTLSFLDHLLQAQAFLPPTELVEMSGFTGTAGTIGSEFDQFDNGKGHTVPGPDGSGFRNQPIRDKVLELINAKPGYRAAFGAVFPTVKQGAPITFEMIGRAVAEFEFTLTFANAPIDRFARGQYDAMSDAEKRGALVFFGKGKCVTCHAVAGKSNEMFSDFQNHVAGIPQLAPVFGAGTGNVIYDGLTRDEDFGMAQLPGTTDADKYKFRTAPLRNAALSPAFFHNGAFTRLEDAIRFHLNPAQDYDAAAAGVAPDLTILTPPRVPASRFSEVFQNGGIKLQPSEIHDLTQFVKVGLLDPRATRENLCSLVPTALPSRMKVATFEGCPSKPSKK